MKQQSNFFLAAGPLLLVLFIDSMGLGLVFPILNGLIFDTHSHFLPEMKPIMHNVIYGAVISIFMLCWFFGAALLGDLSDKIGRKKSLIICLVGAFLSYILSAFAVTLHSLTLLLVGRVVAGFTAGSQPIAQAAIIDISHEDHKSRNIGYILLSLSLGFIFGPLLGGILSDNHLVSWFTFATPFYFAAAVSFFNIALLLVLFKETFVSKATTFSINLYQAIDIFISAFKHEKVSRLSGIFLIFIFGWSSFYSFLPIFLLKVYDFTPTQVSLFMAVMGVGFGVGNGFLVNFLAKFFSLRSNFIVGCIATALIILSILLLHNDIYNWVIVVALAAAASVAYAAILTLFSNQVDAEAQGWVMGITGSIMALVFAVNGLIVGALVTMNASIAMYIAITCLLISPVVTLLFFKSENSQAQGFERMEKQGVSV